VWGEKFEKEPVGKRRVIHVRARAWFGLMKKGNGGKIFTAKAGKL